MLQFAFRYNIGVTKGEAFRDWLLANDAALHEHQPPGWTYLGTWFAVRGFGDFGYESRWELDGYEALGSGFGDDEAQRLSRALFEDFIDWTTRPVTTLMLSAVEAQIRKHA